MEIRNRTPLPAALNVVLDKRAAEHLVLCVKGTWRISSSGRLALAEEQKELLVVDDCVGEPGVSSVRHEADLGPVKPATDCALAGSAIALKAATMKGRWMPAVGGALPRRERPLGKLTVGWLHAAGRGTVGDEVGDGRRRVERLRERQGQGLGLGLGSHRASWVCPEAREALSGAI